MFDSLYDIISNLYSRSLRYAAITPINIEAARCPKKETKLKGITFKKYNEKYIIAKSISVASTLAVILKTPCENSVKNLSLSLKVKLYTEAFISYLHLKL
jgi:hypothetical protein